MPDTLAAPRWPRMVVRALGLRCPHCGARGVLPSWFRLAPACPGCGLRLERGEADYFLGAYLVNLIVAELLVAGILVGVAIATWPAVPWTAIQWGGIAAVLVGVVVAYPFSKLTWLAWDLALRPLTAAELAWHRRGGGLAEELPHR
ncbi:MAG: DUF983 domain-containing protein [Gemmatimonadaceae bacterium]|nr:DUF983 domain-containing protein [Gemmatimonadaceae bacterium]